MTRPCLAAAALAVGFLAAPVWADDVPAPAPAPDAPAVMGLGPAAPPRSERPAFIFLPNGAGITPQAALNDLDRIMAAYEKKPGFYRFPYYKIVQISKNQYQADGMCTWDSPDAKRPPPDPRHNR